MGTATKARVGTATKARKGMSSTMPTRVVIRGQRTEETNPTKERNGGKHPKEEDCDIRGNAPPKIRESDTCGEKGWIEPIPQCVTVVEPLCDHTAKKVVEKRTHEIKVEAKRFWYRPV